MSLFFHHGNWWIYYRETELVFLVAADFWAFPLHFTLAKTGLRVGELTHLLIEELDLESGWLHVRNKSALGWRVKTGSERSVPLLPEVVAVLRRVLGSRCHGPVFLRPRFAKGELPALMVDRGELERICQQRQRQAGVCLSRAEAQRIARTVWRDAGALKADRVRISFIRLMQTIGQAEATCPKSWRHSFATLLQDANVDPLVRQITLGHQPTSGNGLGMTANYTHTRPETQRQQIEQALLYAGWLDSLPQATKDSWLLQWLTDASSNARSEMLAEFRKSRPMAVWPTVQRDRTIADLKAAAEDIHVKAVRQAAEKAAKQRAKRLADMVADPAPTLRETERLVKLRSRDSYLEIARLLKDLREALAGTKQSGLAEQQARKLKKANPTLKLLTAELRRAGFEAK